MLGIADPTTHTAASASCNLHTAVAHASAPASAILSVHLGPDATHAHNTSIGVSPTQQHHDGSVGAVTGNTHPYAIVLQQQQPGAGAGAVIQPVHVQAGFPAANGQAMIGGNNNNNMNAQQQQPHMVYGNSYGHGFYSNSSSTSNNSALNPHAYRNPSAQVASPPPQGASSSSPSASPFSGMMSQQHPSKGTGIPHPGVGVAAGMPMQGSATAVIGTMAPMMGAGPSHGHLHGQPMLGMAMPMPMPMSVPMPVPLSMSSPPRGAPGARYSVGGANGVVPHPQHQQQQPQTQHHQSQTSPMNMNPGQAQVRGSVVSVWVFLCACLLSAARGVSVNT